MFERDLSVEEPGFVSLITLCGTVWAGASADFSDVLVGQVALAHGCGKVRTFDKAAAKLPGFALLA